MKPFKKNLKFLLSIFNGALPYCKVHKGGGREGMLVDFVKKSLKPDGVNL